MVNLAQFRNYMKTQAEEDRNRKWVQVEGTDLDDALRQASIELNVPVKDLEFEIRDPGSKGLLGVGQKNCIIIAYPSAEEKEVGILAEEGFDLGLGDESKKVQDRNGEVFVKLRPEGALLKVTAPIGKGRKADTSMAVAALEARGVERINNSLLDKVVKAADGEYVKVGEFSYNPSQDASMSVDITDFEMKAFLIIRPPGNGGTDISFENIIEFMKSNNVVHGIKEDIIQIIDDRPKYNEPVLVAEGTKPVNGADARVVYNFEIDRSKIKLKEKNGRVDFKETNLVQNVVEGQALAKKIPAESGISGRTVTGKLLPAKEGKDLQIDIGKNVKLTDDGTIAVSEINGQVIMANDKLNVEPIYVVEGDVNLKTGGNVTFLGTVMIRGAVEDGFKVKAAGNIEVMGNLGKCELDAEGDIIVHQGINGKGGGLVRAGKGVWAKFIENAHVEAGELVVATDGIINSNIEANQRIICQGKRAHIVGGKLRASEEIHGKILGSVAGAETILEVGYDPKSKERLLEHEEKVKNIDQQIAEIDRNLKTMQVLQKQKKKLAPEKLVYAKELQKKKAELVSERASLSEEIESIQVYLSSLKIRGRISASDKVFAGVKIFIKDANLDVRNEFKGVTFIHEAGNVKVIKYEKLEEDYTKSG